MKSSTDMFYKLSRFIVWLFCVSAVDRAHAADFKSLSLGFCSDSTTASYYEGFRVEAESDGNETILTMYLPKEAICDRYRLTVHARPSQLMHVLSEEDVIDRPEPHIVRYRWQRKPGEGSPVFRDHMEHRMHLRQTHGRFRVMLVTPKIELVDYFTVPEPEAER